MNPHDLTRRRFIGQACAAVGATGMLSALAQLRMIGALAADTAPTDYKALVCLFLYGGNDSNNLLVPTDNTNYGLYSTARSVLALPQSSLLPIAPKTYSDGRTWGLHPNLPEVQAMFAAGQLAILGNTGTLVQPVTLAQYNSGLGLPTQLFSHADQQVQWQSSISDAPFTTGWGGRLADIVNALNSNPKISMSVSVAGQNSFQVGNTVSQYAVNPSGAITLSGVGTGTGVTGLRTTAQASILSQQEQNLFEAAFGGSAAAAITDSALLKTMLAAAPTLTTTFPTTNIAQQLSMIAKLIGAAPQLGLTRQVFFASLGGFDLHSDQLGAHATLFTQLSQALNAFNSATAELGVQNQVTTFTASDFSRTFNTNGTSDATAGSDHGWGSHHLIMGGAVNGGDIYGTIPLLELGAPEDTGRGRWIPTTSVDEYAATLATWFGVSASSLPVVLPNIGRFATTNLGFMA